MSLEEALIGEMQAAYGDGHKTLPALVQAALLHAEELAEQPDDGWTSQSDQPHAYASEAQTCARQVAYRVLYQDEEELDHSSRFNFAFGNLAHRYIQAALAIIHPDFRPEERWDRGDITGRADGFYTVDGKLVTVEIKTISDKGFRQVQWKGPKPEHICQASISALIYGCPTIHLIYLGKGKKNGLQEFIRPPDLAGAESEMARLRNVVRLTTLNRLPAREWGGVLIRHPMDQKFPCEWCSFKPRCLGRSSDEEDL